MCDLEKPSRVSKADLGQLHNEKWEDVREVYPVIFEVQYFVSINTNPRARSILGHAIGIKQPAGKCFDVPRSGVETP